VIYSKSIAQEDAIKKNSQPLWVGTMGKSRVEVSRWDAADGDTDPSSGVKTVAKAATRTSWNGLLTIKLKRQAAAGLPSLISNLVIM
jgi:hypothetical protein